MPMEYKNNTLYVDRLNVGGRDYPDNAYTRNIQREPDLLAACMYNSYSNRIANGVSKDFQAMIITDSHGNNKAVENAVIMADNFRSIDAIIHNGDIVKDYYNPSEIEQFNSTVGKCTKPYFVCIGNHDVGNTMFVYWSATHEEAYNSFISPMVAKGILKSGEYTTGKPYYYHDFPNRKRRLIVLYEYQAPLDLDDNEYWEPVPYSSSYDVMKPNTTYTYSENNPIILNGSNGFKEYSFRLKKTCTTPDSQYSEDLTMPSFKIGRDERVIMKDQADWLISVLNNTPSDYGVIIATHNPAIINSTNQTDMKFAIRESIRGINAGQYGMSTDLIADIVNAFINKTSLEEKVVMRKSNWHNSDASYLNRLDDGDGVKYAYKIDADFTNKGDSFFVGYIGGHMHADLIFKHDTYEHQWSINPTCAKTGMQKRDCIPSVSDDCLAYDKITVVSFGRNRMVLNKLGSIRRYDGELMDYEIVNV